MNDLLLHVKGADGSSGANSATFDIEAPPDPRVKSDEHMEAFFREVAAIKTQLSTIKERQMELERMHDRAKTLTRSADVKELREQMHVRVGAVNKIALQCKREIDALMKIDADAYRQEGLKEGSHSERTRAAITNALYVKLRDVMSDFQSLRVRLQQDYRDTVQRRVVTVTGNRATEEEIDRMVTSGESEEIFRRVMVEQGRGQVQEVLKEVHERHEAVKELETSLLELHQIFQDMAVVVEGQGEALDNIEQQVGNARDHVVKGVGELQVAKQSFKRGRRWQCCACILVLIIVVIIVVVVVVAVEASK